MVGKVLFLHLGWSSRIGEDGSELGAGTEGRDMFTPVQSFINCLPKGRRAVACARFSTYSNILIYMSTMTSHYTYYTYTKDIWVTEVVVVQNTYCYLKLHRVFTTVGYVNVFASVP